MARRHIVLVSAAAGAIILAGIAVFVVSRDDGSAQGSSSCPGRPFYIDYTGGSDSSGGSKDAPWRLAPGMVGFTGSYAHDTHDCFYFKGGVTWPNAVFPLSISHDGDSTANDYYGVDKTWYSGPAWSRPVFDAGGTQITGRSPNETDNVTNEFIDLSGRSHVTIDGFELRGLYWTDASVFGSCEFVSAHSSKGLTIENLYIHGWSHPADAVDTCFGLLGDTTGTFCTSCRFTHNVVDGSDSTGGGDSLPVLYGWGGSVTNNVIRDTNNLVLAIHGGTISGNLLEGCNPGGHDNFIESHAGNVPNGTYYIHDNIIRDGADSCESIFLGGPDETDYVWNNVIYGLTGNAPAVDNRPGNDTVATYWWNNTIVAGDRGESCFRGGAATLVFQNNHCITRAASAVDPSRTCTTCVIDHNLLQTPDEAAADGFVASSAHPYAPTSQDAATTGKGTNLSTECAGRTASLCAFTPNHACTLDTRTNSPVCPTTPVVTRPPVGAWDIGAYG